jgi:hypothetical protein
VWGGTGEMQEGLKDKENKKEKRKKENKEWKEQVNRK